MTADRQGLIAGVEAMRPRLLRYLATMIADAAAAEDLTQEALRRGLDRIDALRDPDRLQSWMYAIAINLCRAHLRRAVHDERSLELDPDSLRGSVLSSIVQRESAEVLALAIDRLPILLREAFVLHVVEGLPYREIAEIADSSVEALHVRTHRAKALLRRQLGSVVDTFWSEAR